MQPQSRKSCPYDPKSYANPPAFQTFTIVRTQSVSAYRIDGLSNLTKEQGADSPKGFRLYFSSIINETVDVKAIVWSLILALIVTAVHLQIFPTGRNLLGAHFFEYPIDHHAADSWFEPSNG